MNRPFKTAGIITSSVFILGILFLNQFFARTLFINPLPPVLHEPMAVSRSLLPLSPETISRIIEIARLDGGTFVGDVITMQQPDKNDADLMVLYHDGTFRNWDITDKKVTSEFDFHSASRNAVNFSLNGPSILTPNQVISDGVYGYSVWDCTSGERLVCKGTDCPDSKVDDTPIFDHGILLDAQSRWVIEYSEGVIGISGIGDHFGGVMNLDYPEDDLRVDIERIIQDKSGNYTAYFTSQGEGKVTRSTDFIDENGQGVSIRKDRTLGSYDASAKIRVVDFAFSDTLENLALLRNKDLIVWDLDAVSRKPSIQIPITTGSSIAFSHSGRLLAVGTTVGFQILDLDMGQWIAEFEGRVVSDIYFAKDDRMILWGDSQGVIHMWGVSE